MLQTTLFGTKVKKKDCTRDDFFTDNDESAQRKASRSAHARSTIYFDAHSGQFLFKKYDAVYISENHWRVIPSQDENAIRPITN